MAIPEAVLGILYFILGTFFTVMSTFWIAKIADKYFSLDINSEAIARRIQEYRRRDRSVILQEMNTEERLHVLERALDIRVS